MYYRKDLAKLITSWCGSLVGKGFNDEAKLAWYVGLGIIPVGLVGISLSALQKGIAQPFLLLQGNDYICFIIWGGQRSGLVNGGPSLKMRCWVGPFQALVFGFPGGYVQASPLQLACYWV
ncbi:MAG: hypothetical protein H0A75_00835 [Candidatus Methanofishera endochildressiae]|uniref:Uncharacterized protein n=1 Tax=Candidatus Methanofishera endochildressiae TaxID=2738884 RepID=A0A7Z0MMT8_9GAMM|nr:hypothetical protein [Candidatus Methanofishera endochildressiae]